MDDAEHIKELQAELAALRNFPSNTTPASRHLEMIADSLASNEKYVMLEEEPEHCAITIYAVLTGFYKARNQLDTMDNNHRSMAKLLADTGRERDEARSQLGKRTEALKELFDLCLTVGDFKNGVTHQGIDEGEVFAGGIFDKAKAALSDDYGQK